MVKNQKQRNRRIPIRTCVGCRQALSKRELMRIVRTPDGVRFDPTGKMNGRGAYIHDTRACWERAVKGSLENALHASLSEADREHLRAIMDSLPEETDEKKE